MTVNITDVATELLEEVGSLLEQINQDQQPSLIKEHLYRLEFSYHKLLQTVVNEVGIV